MFAFHGFYEEERILGNHFIVNIKVGFEPSTKINDLVDTVNYEGLLELVKLHFSTTRYLLEELAEAIEHDTKLHYPHIHYFFLSIKKKHPPFGMDIESSEVSLEKRYGN